MKVLVLLAFISCSVFLAAIRNPVAMLALWIGFMVGAVVVEKSPAKENKKVSP